MDRSALFIGEIARSVQFRCDTQALKHMRAQILTHTCVTFVCSSDELGKISTLQDIKRRQGVFAPAACFHAAGLCSDTSASLRPSSGCRATHTALVEVPFPLSLSLHLLMTFTRCVFYYSSFSFLNCCRRVAPSARSRRKFFSVAAAAADADSWAAARFQWIEFMRECCPAPCNASLARLSALCPRDTLPLQVRQRGVAAQYSRRASFGERPQSQSAPHTRTQLRHRHRHRHHHRHHRYHKQQQSRCITDTIFPIPG